MSAFACALPKAAIPLLANVGHQQKYEPVPCDRRSGLRAAGDAPTLRALFAEARRLRLPIVLVSEEANSTLAKWANAVLVIPRGKPQRVALHGGTLVGREAIALALAAANRDGAVATLERLNTLRIAVSGQRHDVG